MKAVKLGLWLLVTSMFFLSCGNPKVKQYDVCVYGGTSAGVIAAYRAAQMGKTVLLIEPEKHLGGMTASGLGWTDIGERNALTGFTIEYYKRVLSHYGKEDSVGLIKPLFEPHVAENEFNKLVAEAGFDTLLYHRIVEAKKQDGKISEIIVENTLNPDTSTNKTIKAKVFIDCTYEGDLMARAGVSYTIGREDNSVYNENHNGFRIAHSIHQFPDGIDPYVIPGDSTSGYVKGIKEDGEVLEKGTGDKGVQAYNFRVCLTDVDSNKIPITKPDNYDPANYELLARIGEKKTWTNLSVPPWRKDVFVLLIISPLPNGKTDCNNYGGMSTDFIGGNWSYPEADFPTREKIKKAHEDYQKGLYYFIGHSERIPEDIRNEMLEYGYCKDEFTDNGGWPFQLYVREARRMIGEYVMTEHNVLGDTVVKDGIAIGSYGIDSHNTQRIVVDGEVKNEGDFNKWMSFPYPISYKAIVPKKEECTNLVVPVCMSASHSGYGSIRMEPVFMMMGEAAGAAACLAIDNDDHVQEVDYDKLVEAIDYKMPVYEK
jgi:hypothetical protein